MVIWPTLEPSTRHHKAATGNFSGLMDSRYVGDNHEPKNGQNGLVTKWEIESEGNPMIGANRLWFFVFGSYDMCVCVYKFFKKY